ncbi:MAG: NAD-dependent epimerase/dehydratase family protein [bacterium]|nr:NAD-dependent epimerase/dehydratase family protein [bacterium]
MSDPARILLIGGSGFLSGTLAQQAVSQGHQVWAVTRGQRPLPEGVTPIVADRRNPESLQNAIQDTGLEWDFAVDCICYDPEDAAPAIAVLKNRTPHLVFVSTDFVFDPYHRVFPQPEETEHYLADGYGGKKRLCELEYLNGDTGDMAWTVARPCHIYGPGSKLGCLPLHGRDDDLIAKIQAGKSLQLVGGGHFLQQPILARDLSDLILSFRNNTQTYNEIFCTPGAETIESREFYGIIADVLGVARPPIEEISVHQFLEENPGQATFCCHRIYSQDKLKASGAKVPATPVAQGLQEHVESLLS